MIVRRALVGALVAISIIAASQGARAEATVGLWVDMRKLPAEQHTEPSKDAALVIGIDRYDALPHVTGAADNARDWEKYFLFARRVSPERVTLLTDQNATVESISASAKELAAKVPEGGTLFVIFIGHGAPGQGGQKGLLLGADVRPSDASFAARSVSYDQLETYVSAGTQARTVMVLDACFSGVDAGGKTLIPNVQPVIATSLIASAKTTVFSAGTAAEYAGALPGSQRPALSYLLLGALRGWADDDGDGNVTVPEAFGYVGKVLRSLPNNHEQHPQLLPDSSTEPLETNAREKGPDLAVIRSKLDTWRAPVEEKPQPKLRVAVGCGDKTPRGTDDGLDIYLDRSPAAATPSGGEKVWDPELKQNVVDHIEFPITPGRHHVLVRIAGCEPMETEIEADGTVGARLGGVLRSASSVLVHGPAGSPDWGRIGVALWMPRSFMGNILNKMDYAEGARTAYGGVEYGVKATGIFVQPALTFRWWTLGMDLGFASGSVEHQNATPATPALAAASAKGDVQWARAGLRAGVRFPFNVVAFSLGVGGGYDSIKAENLAPGLSASGIQNSGYGSAWAMLDGHVFCDWPVFAGVDAQVHAGSYEDAGTLSILIGAAFQPNKTCKIERSTKYELTQGEPSRHGKQAAK